MPDRVPVNHPMRHHVFCSLLALLGSVPSEGADPGDPLQVSFAFWNLENLFDAADDPTNPGDDQYLPANEWNDERYARKLSHLAQALAALDADLLGVCEVENRRVLEDLIAQPQLRERRYRIAHMDTPDKRGIDMGLLYRLPCGIGGKPTLHLIDLGADVPPTRGVLEVPIVVDDVQLTVLVNHWPSRYGGKEKSAPLRAMAARTTRAIVDERMHEAEQLGAEAEILVLGDFNDDPFDPSVHDVLGAVRERRTVSHPYNLRTRNEKQTAPRLYNPTWALLADGDGGTYYYWNEWTWNVFDQAIMSPGLLDEVGLSYVEGTLQAHAPPFVRDSEVNAGRPRPFRRFRGRWEEGYSDHFAIRGQLVLNAKRAPRRDD